ncbi:dihydrofolate reductase [Chitinophagaceae bacterium LB-8]|uniref:Dihydrofolate reductase n=1 Tax=Paraflavisolibacter caeni TaxID=2982496 RepID=A0A9X3BI19_9BACT|nr:dihydrofolate reductase [Paraflavisolibacter caeni]MCU7550567.1 dihydrofolate reductase [Paraflavisolibacter caeni]
MNNNNNEHNDPGYADKNNRSIILSLLVAADENNVIGKDNKLPWHLPNDLKYFKNLTWGMPILMGRKTFESIGKALPGRKSIVITRNTDWQKDGVDVVHSIEEAIEKAKEFDVKEIFVIGGAEIFRTSFIQANRIYLTRIHHKFDGDAFFPELPDSEWKLASQRHCPADEKNAYQHTYQVWNRVS